MEELIYQFLLQSGYPRAALISNLSQLPGVPPTNGNGTVPTFAVVNPDDAECLAVIKVIGANEADDLDQHAVTTGQFANQMGREEVQGFVIRVDFNAPDESSQVQFHRVWPGDSAQQLTAKTFPDIDSLKVAHKLMKSGAGIDASDGVRHRSRAFGRTASRRRLVVPWVGLYLPAVALTVLLLLDWTIEFVTGSGILSDAQSNLAVGIALLLTLPAAIRYLGSVSNQPN